MPFLCVHHCAFPLLYQSDLVLKEIYLQIYIDLHTFNTEVHCIFDLTYRKHLSVLMFCIFQSHFVFFNHIMPVLLKKLPILMGIILPWLKV